MFCNVYLNIIKYVKIDGTYTHMYSVVTVKSK